MPASCSTTLTCPLESERAAGGLNVIPSQRNDTSAPATGLPSVPFTCTARGSDNLEPTPPICLPPLTSTICVPYALGVGNGLAARCLVQPERIRMTTRPRVAACFILCLPSDAPSTSPGRPSGRALRHPAGWDSASACPD